MTSDSEFSVARYIPYIMFFGSAVALGFLGYSLLNLSRLGIGPLHPRVLVEAGLGIVLAAAGFLLMPR